MRLRSSLCEPWPYSDADPWPVARFHRVAAFRPPRAGHDEAQAYPNPGVCAMASAALSLWGRSTLLAGCARAATDQAATPQTAAMNSRRFSWSNCIRPDDDLLTLVVGRRLRLLEAGAGCGAPLAYIVVMCLT